MTLIRSAKTIFMGVGSEKTGSEDFDKTRVGGTFKIKGGNKKGTKRVENKRATNSGTEQEKLKDIWDTETMTPIIYRQPDVKLYLWGFF